MSTTKTIWLDAPDIQPQNWLLKDGSVVTTPPIERTASNKRLRVKGTTTSMGIRQLDKLVSEAIQQIAAKNGTERWLQLQSPEAQRVSAASQINQSINLWNEALTLHLFLDRSTNQARREHTKTVAVWGFKARGLPLMAYVFVELQSHYGGTTYVNTRVVHRTLHPADNNEGNNYWTNYQQESWQRLAYNVGYYGPEHDALEKITESDAHPFGSSPDRPKAENRNFGSQPRRAVAFMLQQCEAINQLAEITLPDTRDPLNPQWLTYDFAETNYSGSFSQELRDFQQTGPIMERIKERYQELMADLELLGVVLPKRPDDSAFEQAINGDFTELAVGAHPQHDADTVDSHHVVYLNFPSGTITVSCTGPSHMADAKAQWEIDKFRYEATGEMSELLAYARGFYAKPERKRAKKIAAARAFDPDQLTD